MGVNVGIRWCVSFFPIVCLLMVVVFYKNDDFVIRIFGFCFCFSILLFLPIVCLLWL